MHPGFFERTHLVVHQGDQGADHHGHALVGSVAGNGGNLVTKAFAAACGHEHQGITALTHMGNDVCLRAAKLAVAEHLVQDGVQNGMGRRRAIEEGGHGVGKRWRPPMVRHSACPLRAHPLQGGLRGGYFVLARPYFAVKLALPKAWALIM